MQLALSQNDKKLCAKVAAFDVRASLFFFSGGNSCVPSVAIEQVRAANFQFLPKPNSEIRLNGWGLLFLNFCVPLVASDQRTVAVISVFLLVII